MDQMMIIDEKDTLKSHACYEHNHDAEKERECRGKINIKDEKNIPIRGKEKSE